MLGNKTTKLSKEELNDFAKCYGETIVDLGTGNGRFVYKSATKNPDSFYIGVDPSEKQLKEYSRKAVRKKLPNIIFCLGSIEILPKELRLVSKELFSPQKTLFQPIYPLHPPDEPSETPGTRRSPVFWPPVSTHNRMRSLSQRKSIAEYSCAASLRFG